MKEIQGKEAAMTRIEAYRFLNNRDPVSVAWGPTQMEGRIVGISSGLGGITTATVKNRFGPKVLRRVPIKNISPSVMGIEVV